MSAGDLNSLYSGNHRHRVMELRPVTVDSDTTITGNHPDNCNPYC